MKEVFSVRKLRGNVHLTLKVRKRESVRERERERVSERGRERKCMPQRRKSENV